MPCQNSFVLESCIDIDWVVWDDESKVKGQTSKVVPIWPSVATATTVDSQQRRNRIVTFNSSQNSPHRETCLLLSYFNSLLQTLPD